MTGHRGCRFVGLPLVVALTALIGCQKKTPEASKGAKGAAATAEAMPAVAPDMAPEPARPATPPDMAAAPRVAPVPDAAVKQVRKGPLRKGSKEYNARLRELTNLTIASGDDKFKSVSIVGRCKGKECNEMGAIDHLRRGVGGPSLDDAARTASGPRSGSSGRRARPASRPVAPRSHVSAFVPPVAIAGAAGSRVRAKIRARLYGLKKCHRREMIKNPKAYGTAKIRFTIATNGRLNSVSVTGTPSSLIACVKGKVKRWFLGKVPKATPYGPFTVRFTVKKK